MMGKRRGRIPSWFSGAREVLRSPCAAPPAEEDASLDVGRVSAVILDFVISARKFLS